MPPTIPSHGGPSALKRGPDYAAPRSSIGGKSSLGAGPYGGKGGKGLGEFCVYFYLFILAGQVAGVGTFYSDRAGRAGDIGEGYGGIEG
jgi:hypothetical protein